MLFTSIYYTACAQSDQPNNNESGAQFLKSASLIVEKLNPQISKVQPQGSASYFKFTLDLSCTKAVIPDAIRTGTNWTQHGKNTPKAVNFETIDYSQLVPVLVAALQDQQAQIAELKNEIANLKKGTKNR
jgi:hypothetical protein